MYFLIELFYLFFYKVISMFILHVTYDLFYHKRSFNANPFQTLPKEMLSNSFYKARFTLLPKPEKHNIRKATG